MRQEIMKIPRDPNAGDDAGIIHSDHFRITDLIIRRRYTMYGAISASYLRKMVSQPPQGLQLHPPLTTFLR